jgi:7,8-dihydro-6-hydroxymethylpterin-pyrophosphokinase
MMTPAQIMERLEEIEQDLGLKQNEYERAASEWFGIRRDKEKAWATAYLGADDGAVTDRKASAILASEDVGREEEARYVALKAAIDVLMARATIGQSLLRAHGRIG